MKHAVKTEGMKLVNELIKPDAKKRISLGFAMQEDPGAYNVYTNDFGQIVLDPVKAVPAYEVWLFENDAALAAVREGIAQAAAGKTKDLGSFARYAK